MQSQAHTSFPQAIGSRTPRLFGWLLITILLMSAIWCVSPHQLPVSLYKLSLVTLAAVAGYWLDRSLFPYARPDTFLSGSATDRTALVFAAAMLRRAIIVGCAMLAMGLGA